MSPWLTFVVGIIIGLLAGWAIDLLYRARANRPRDPDPIESGLASPAPDAALPAAASGYSGGAVATEGADQPVTPVEPVAPELPLAPEPRVDAEAPDEPVERGRDFPATGN